MEIQFERLSSLPPLAWYAHAHRLLGLRVVHGDDVETRPEGFVEGAWDGDFDALDFDTAETLAGTGGRVRGDSVVFAAPFHPLERLFVLRRDEAVFVSNSLVFLLEAAGDGLDLSYPHYFFDLLSHVRRGIAAGPERLRTASGNCVELFRCCNLELRADLTSRKMPKPLGQPPDCYADYFALLRRTTQDLARNAMSPARQKRYPLVAACSRGYDSTAATALASLAGCREGVTFSESAGLAGYSAEGPIIELYDDSGADSLRALGMTVTEYSRKDFATLPGHPRAEFFSSPASNTDAGTRVMEDSVRGRVLVSGRHGERYWGLTSRCKRLNFAEIDDCQLSGHSLTEFRLRTGTVHFPLPYVGVAHAPAIYRITKSAEMRPWLLGTGYYDRPIARRIAEEAGVPRENFGHKKFGAGAMFREENSESKEDFRAFLRDRVPERIQRSMDPRPLSERRTRHRSLSHFRTHYAHLPLVARALDVFQADRWNMMWNSIYLYQFHWGVDRIRHRYATSSLTGRAG